MACEFKTVKPLALFSPAETVLLFAPLENPSLVTVEWLASFSSGLTVLDSECRGF
jgi:hypothetical protein